MVDPGFVPGLIGVLLQTTINQIVRHIRICWTWKKALADLKDTLVRIEPIVELALNNQDEVSVVDNWFQELYALLKQASEIVEKCITVRSWDAVSRLQTGTKISTVTKDIDKHLARSGLVHMVQFQAQIRKILDGNKQIIEAVAAHSIFASISQAGHEPVGITNSKEGDKTTTGTASGHSNLLGVSSFQDQQLDYHLAVNENPMADYVEEDFVSHDVEEEEDRNEKQRFGKVLCDYQARYDYEVNLTAEEQVQILEEQGDWFRVSKKQPGTNIEVEGWAHMLFVDSSYNSFSVANTKHLQEDFVSHDVEEEEDRNEKQRFGRVLCDYQARYDDEVNLTAEEQVEILEEQGDWFRVSKKQPGTNIEVEGWAHMLFVDSSYNSFSVANTKHLQGDKTVTGTASRPGNVSKVSSFQDEQLDSLVYESYENPMAGQGSVSHDVEEEDCTENQWFGQVLCDFPASCDDELNVTAGEEVEILEEHGEWLFVRKKWLGRGGKMEGWVHALFVNSSYRKS